MMSMTTTTDGDDGGGWWQKSAKKKEKKKRKKEKRNMADRRRLHRRQTPMGGRDNQKKIYIKKKNPKTSKTRPEISVPSTEKKDKSVDREREREREKKTRICRHFSLIPFCLFSFTELFFFSTEFFYPTPLGWNGFDRVGWVGRGGVLPCYLWVERVFTGFYRVLPGFTEFSETFFGVCDWVLPGSTWFSTFWFGFYQVPCSLNGFFMVELGFYRVLPGYTEFSETFLDFMGFYRVFTEFN